MEWSVGDSTGAVNTGASCKSFQALGMSHRAISIRLSLQVETYPNVRNFPGRKSCQLAMEAR